MENGKNWGVVVSTLFQMKAYRSVIDPIKIIEYGLQEQIISFFFLMSPRYLFVVDQRRK